MKGASEVSRGTFQMGEIQRAPHSLCRGDTLSRSEYIAYRSPQAVLRCRCRQGVDSHSWLCKGEFHFSKEQAKGPRCQGQFRSSAGADVASERDSAALGTEIHRPRRPDVACCPAAVPG